MDRSVYLDKNNLNDLDAKSMGRIINRLEASADIAYVDACDVNALCNARFGRNVAKISGGAKVRFAYHKADERFVIVSAASIIAKVARDRAVLKLGIDGSGYPSDPKSKRYLARYIRKHRRAPSCARQSWKPVIIALKR